MIDRNVQRNIEFKINLILQFIMREYAISKMPGVPSNPPITLFIDDTTYDDIVRSQYYHFSYDELKPSTFMGLDLYRIRTSRTILILEFKDGTSKITYPYIPAIKKEE